MTGYFHRVAEETPTRFWINNPSIEEAKLALAAGAVGCTTNPSHTAKKLQEPHEMSDILPFMREAIERYDNDSDAAEYVYIKVVERLSKVFLPLYETSLGTQGAPAGYVTFQSDPLREEESDYIVAEGLRARTFAPNIMVKIPVTQSGIAAIKTLVAHNCPVMATEVMSIAQALCISEAYKEASSASGHTPPFYITHITGILDDHFKNVVKERHLTIEPEIMAQAGISIAKKEYALLRSRRLPGIMIGGGARKLADFTELVGGNLAITINWKGTADALIEQNPPIENRIGLLPSDETIAYLRKELPDYERAYDDDGMTPNEFFDYGGVALFRSQFVASWRTLMAAIAAERGGKS